MVAPGDILTLEYLDPDAYVVAGGTSLACPIVSGIASLVMSIDRGLNPPLHDMDVQRILELTAVDLGAQGFDSLSYAWGRVNAQAALEYVTSNLILNDLTVPEGQATQYGDPTAWTSVLWNFPPPPHAPGEYLSRRYEVRTGTVEFPITFSEVPDVWTRLGGTVGRDAADPQEFDFPWGDVVDTTTTSCVLRTYVYEVDIGEAENVWWPAPPSGVRFAYTVAGTANPSAAPEDGATPGQPLAVQATVDHANGSQHVHFRLLPSGDPSEGELTVYDVSGRVVWSIRPMAGQTDDGVVVWNGRTTAGRDAPSGVYFATWRMQGLGSARTRFVLVR